MKILIQPDGAKPRQLTEGFANELELQSFLRDHAALIPMDEIKLGTPPLLCVGWEVSAGGGSEALLYVDESGLLTVVETKLGRNAESRRKVVGQILEYAANTVSWTGTDVESRVNKFLASRVCPEDYRGTTFDMAIQRFLDKTDSPRLVDYSYPEFLDAIAKNLEAGRIRLIIAVDEPPEPLRRVVDFVNRFSEHFQMYLFQLKRFRDEATRANIFVPELFGQPPTASRHSEVWDESKFMNHVQNLKDAALAECATEAYVAFKGFSDASFWGTGSTFGSYNLAVPTASYGKINLGQVTSRGDIYVFFGNLYRKLPARSIPDTLAASLNEIEGVSFPQPLDTKYPPLPTAILRDPARRGKAIEAILAAATEIRDL